MALIECPDCHQQISNSAPACPHCGRPIREARADRELLSDKGQETDVRRGTQRSKMRYELGGAVAFGGIILGIFVGFAASSLTIGFVLVVAAIVLGLFVQFK